MHSFWISYNGDEFHTLFEKEAHIWNYWMRWDITQIKYNISVMTVHLQGSNSELAYVFFSCNISGCYYYTNKTIFRYGCFFLAITIHSLCSCPKKTTDQIICTAPSVISCLNFTNVFFFEYLREKKKQGCICYLFYWFAD